MKEILRPSFSNSDLVPMLVTGKEPTEAPQVLHSPLIIFNSPLIIFNVQKTFLCHIFSMPQNDTVKAQTPNFLSDIWVRSE